MGEFDTTHNAGVFSETYLLKSSLISPAQDFTQALSARGQSATLFPPLAKKGAEAQRKFELFLPLSLTLPPGSGQRGFA